MTKEKEISFIKKEAEVFVSTLEKRDAFNTQVIEELDKQLSLSKYGSVGHVNKVVRLSSMRNYKLRLTEAVQIFKEITDMVYIDNVEKYIKSVLDDAKANLKVSTDSLNSVELFSNDYIKNEILSKTYKDLVDLYTEIETVLSKIKEGPAVEETVDEQPVESTFPPKGTIVKPTKKGSDVDKETA